MRYFDSGSSNIVSNSSNTNRILDQQKILSPDMFRKPQKDSFASPSGDDSGGYHAGYSRRDMPPRTIEENRDYAASWRHLRRRPTEEDQGQSAASDPEFQKRRQEQAEREMRYSNGQFVGFNTAQPRKPSRYESKGQGTGPPREAQLGELEETESTVRPMTSWRTVSLDPNRSETEASGNITEEPRRVVREDHDDRRIGVARDPRFDDRRKKPRRNTLIQSENEDEVDDEAAKKIEWRRQRKREKMEKKTRAPPTPILLPKFISVGNLASALRTRVEDFISKLYDMGFEEVSLDHVVDAETAGLIATEFNFEPLAPQASTVEDLVAQPQPDDTSSLLARPPVITIMGHVDHGKTTLLDWVRKSSVAASEHGGITQHIGAFTVPMPSGRIITFLDTPGHEAFLDMRARGANVTDIVILVVAADDSVKPQTIEAIKHARAARVPIIVAITKIDKPDANPERVKQDLARHGVDVEDFGGDTQAVCVSGRTGQGMPDLEDAAVALADVLDARADTTGPVEGWVLEGARRASGKVATVLVRRGTLSPGVVLVADHTWTRVRSLRNEAGVTVREALPGTPVEVDGWREQPGAGAEVLQAPDEQRARKVVELRQERAETARTAADVAAVNEARRAAEEERRARELQASARKADVAEKQQEPQAPGLTEIPFVLRADVSGSAEALSTAVLALGNAEVRPSILRTQVGPPSPSDVEHAATTGGHIVAFNVPVDAGLLRAAERAGVRILDESVIYRLVDEAKGVLEEKLAPIVKSRVLGEAEIAQVFEYKVKSGKIKVAGCRVRNGVIGRAAKVKVMRRGEKVYDGMSSACTRGSLRCDPGRFSLFGVERQFPVPKSGTNANSHH